MTETTKQPATGAGTENDDRTAQYAAIDRQGGTPADSEKLKALHRQPREETKGRSAAYVRLDRGVKP